MVWHGKRIKFRLHGGKHKHMPKHKGKHQPKGKGKHKPKHKAPSKLIIF